jgi:hypothetical protein
MSFKDELIKLGSEQPELRKHIRPVLDRISGQRLASREELGNMLPGGVFKTLERSLDLSGAWKTGITDTFRGGNSTWNAVPEALEVKRGGQDPMEFYFRMSTMGGQLALFLQAGHDNTRIDRDWLMSNVSLFKNADQLAGGVVEYHAAERVDMHGDDQFDPQGVVRELEDRAKDAAQDFSFAMDHVSFI